MSLGCFTSSLQHILAELERIDLFLRVQVWRARHLNGTDREFLGLGISDEEVDNLLSAKPLGLPKWAMVDALPHPNEVRAALDEISAEINRRKLESAKSGTTLRLDELVEQFQLTAFDIDVILVCLASELDLRYQRLYAYLQENVTKIRPCVDLVLNLLCSSPEKKVEARQRFGPEAPLIKHDLVQIFDDPDLIQPPLLSRYLKVNERIIDYLLDSDEVDARCKPILRCIVPEANIQDLLLPDGIKSRLSQLVSRNRDANGRLVLYFQGGYGLGKQTTAEALCNQLEIKLLTVDLALMLDAQQMPFEKAIQLVMREALLQEAAPYVKGFDCVLSEDKQAALAVFLEKLQDFSPPLLFLAGSAPWEPVDSLHDMHFVRVEFSRPHYIERMQLWAASLNRHLTSDSKVDVAGLANKFQFSGGQIRDTAATARNIAIWRDPQNGHMTTEDLYAASRLQSNQRLSTLARKTETHYSWDDIVLPPDRMQQLREICNYVKYKAQVYNDWGFENKLAMGKGLNSLFAGPSGTGKTMAAGIIAGELGLDLYKIDLSSVVSKFIGETEKNLARIFDEAESSNSILFFDEADALFGKRSEVRDSHDRYANIEISYLLQRMEEYTGIVILATNLRKNMDEAFVRRMHFTVDFPFPSANDRRRIWETVWPDSTPRTSSLDLDFMARSFEVAGGNIRNIALAAAFLAADEAGVVDMPHLVRATRREYQKMGKIITDNEFGAYAKLLIRQ